MAASSIELSDGPAPPTFAVGERTERPGSKPVRLWLLTVVLAILVVDQQVFNVLGNQIGRDLHLSDSQLGFIGGLGFSIVFFAFGFPWGWLADQPKTSRVWVISATVAIFSSMTAVCGLAGSYSHLLVARMGMAAGEAGCAPAAQSLIVDSTPKAKLARALAMFGLGIPIGAGLAKALGGVLSDLFGWRSAYFIVGVPGLLLSVALPFFLRDPRRHGTAIARARKPSLVQAARELLRSRTIVYLTIGTTVTSALVTGASFWGLMHFQRNLGMTAGQAGLSLGLLRLCTGVFGKLSGGWLADRMAAKNPRHYMTPAIIGMLLTPPMLIFAWRTNQPWIALSLLLFPTMFDNINYGGVTAATQRLLSSNVRTMATAVISMVGTLAAATLGVTAFGLASDVVRAHLPMGAHPNESIRYVLMGAAVAYLVPAFCFWRASLNIGDELDRLEINRTAGAAS